MPDNSRDQLIDRLVGRVEELERRQSSTTQEITNIYNDNSINVRKYDLGKILRFDPTYTTVEQYPTELYEAVTATDLDNALADATSGDIILLPAGTIDGDHTMIAGVKVVGRSRYATILSGQITGANGASIENLSVIRSANSAANLIGVDAPAAGTFYISDCDIEVTQSGSGDAYGISADVNGTLIEVWNSFVSGDSTGGTGYGGYRDTGTSATAHFYGGRVYGSDNPFNV